MSNFSIEIELSDALFNNEINQKISYYRNSDSKDFFDKVKFYKNKIYIEGSRTKKIQIETAFFTQYSTYYQDIVKSLLFAYFLYGRFRIKKVKMTVNGNSKVINENELSQKFDCDLEWDNKLDINNLKIIFENSGRSEVLMRSLMYLVTSFYSKENRFDNVWKSFNVLLKSTTKKDKDFDMLKCFRGYLENNPDKFEKMCIFIENYVDELYLEQCRVNAMIKNNHPQLKDEQKEIKDFKERMILNYDDVRLCRLMKEKMKTKRKLLEKHNEYSLIKDELDNRISKNIKNDVDIIRFIVLKYAYYLRCKYFHGEKWVNQFIFINDDSKELDRIYEPLKTIIFDMINNKVWI